MVQLTAFDQAVRTIEDLVRRADESDSLAPVIHLVGPIVVCLIGSIGSEASGEIKKPSFRDRVLVIVSAIRRGNLPACISLLVQSLREEKSDLPSETSTASLIIPSTSLLVEDGLRESEPLWVFWWRVREARLGGHERCDGPRYLVIVALCRGLVPGHEVSCRARLP